MRVYRFCTFLVRIFLFVFCRFQVVGKNNCPAEGPVVVVSNHTSFWDPVIIASALERRVRFMAKEELFHIFLLGWFLNVIGCFPVKRGQGDRAAIRAALGILKDGEVLGIFPEGGRSKTGDIQKPFTGAAMLALKSGSPILPVACLGTHPWISRRGIGPFTVAVAEPITYDQWYGKRLSTAQLEDISRGFMGKIENLLVSSGGK